MNKEFNIGDIVREGTVVTSIKKIVNGEAILARNHEVDLDSLSQVEINGGYDGGIILVCETMRSKFVTPGIKTPLRKDIPYIESSIDGKTIASIIEENGFTKVSELQEWMAQYAPDYSLRTKLGI